MPNKWRFGFFLVFTKHLGLAVSGEENVNLIEKKIQMGNILN